MDPSSRLLPEGTHLLHIGPQKTGSSAVQAALHARRAELPAYGVVYPGESPKPVRAVRAGLGLGWRRGVGTPPARVWERYCRQVEQAGDRRVVVSSEALARLEDDRIDLVVRRLGGARPHVLLAARDYPRLLPSQWQQRVRIGEQRTFEDWLRTALDPAHGLWRPHRTGELVRRWGDRVGLERVTVVVHCERPRWLLEVLEEMLGLPAGFLPVVSAAANRSLTLQEVELLRAVNAVFADDPRIGPSEWRRLVRHGLVPALVRRPAPEGHDPLPGLPAWARETVDALSRQRVADLSSLGVRVVGDLRELEPRPRAAAGAVAPTDQVPLETVAAAIRGMVLGVVSERATPPARSPRPSR